MGNDTETIIRQLTAAIQHAQKTEKVAVLMPPRIVEEIKSFFEDPEQPFLQEFFACISVQSPDLLNLKIPAELLARYIEESRLRAYRGMTIAEEEIAKTGTQFMGSEMLGKKEFQMSVGHIIKSFRERFRNATRTKFLDSVADFDLIALAMQKNAYLVTSDEGVTQWGRLCGVKEMDSQIFGKKMLKYL